MKKECENCGKIFEATRRQKYCGNSLAKIGCSYKVKLMHSRKTNKLTNNNYRKTGKVESPYTREFSSLENEARDCGYF